MKRCTGFTAALLAAIGVGAAPASDAPVPREYFGLHIHRADQGTAWPSVPFGSWRLWDAYVTWANMEPERGKWDFSRLDRYVAMAELTKVDILLPLANTPAWAAARPSEKSAYKPGNASEPLDIDDWKRYVQTIGERYRGRIFHYEIWNEPNIKHHFSGNIEKLVEITCEAYKTLKTIDTRNLVVSPAATTGARDHLEYLGEFLALGGSRCVDIIAHHFYVPRQGPEAMVPIIRQVKEVMLRNGVGHLPLWNTETGWRIANSDGTPEDPRWLRGWRRLEQIEAGEVLQRAFILARAEGVERFYWYAWDNKNMGLVEPKLASLKPAAEVWVKTVNQMKGKVVKNCTRSIVGKWSCELMNVDRSVEVFRWDEGDGLKPREGDR